MQREYIVTIFRVRVVESPLNDRRLFNERNFQPEQVPSAKVIYNDTVHIQRSTADSQENQTQRYYLT